MTWRSLLALGISGGLVPCPSALVVLLSAIALQRVGYGLVLIVAFSAGLAAVLTGVGMLFVHAGHLLERTPGSRRLLDAMGVVGPAVITVAGLAICVQALGQWGFGLEVPLAGTASTAGGMVTASILGLGLLLGGKHALDADHLAAVSAIVSERRSVLSSSLVGGLWGLGHTIALLAAGFAVLVLRVEIGPRTAMSLEFGVALMLIALGIDALWKLRRGAEVHVHVHAHDGSIHAHAHAHGAGVGDAQGSRKGIGIRPLVVGMIHGLAGSSALMLLVLSTIPSVRLGLVYLMLFGVGSVGGMMLMSALFGLPFHLTSRRFERAHLAIRGLAGVFSLGFGLFMAYEIGVVDGLLL